MKKFVSTLGYEYIAHNKAQKEAQAAFKSMNRRVINPDQLKSFKKELQDKITKINTNNPRCKDLVLDTDDGRISAMNNGDLQLSIYGLISINLYWGEE